MRIKRLTAVLIIVVIALVAFSSFQPKSEHYEKYKEYKYAYFPSYSTVNHFLSQSDREKADELISRARAVFTSVDGNLPENAGGLERYSPKEPGVKSVKLDIEAVAGDFTFNNGYLWVIYSAESFDEYHRSLDRSRDVLSYWELKLKDGVWTVEKIKEPA